MTMTDDRLDIYLADPDDLTAAEEELLEVLRHAEPEEFDDLMRKHVAAPSESTQMVFRHPDVVEQAVQSLYRLQAGAQQRAQHARNADMRRLYQDQVQKYGRERSYFRPYLNLALAEAAKNTSRARAERMLGRLRYPELKAIIRDFDSGLPEKEVEARAKERLRTRPAGSKSAKT